MNEPAYAELVSEFGHARVVEALRDQIDGERLNGATGDAERVLKVGMRIVRHARRATLVIAETAAAYWQDLWRALDRLAWNTA